MGQPVRHRPRRLARRGDREIPRMDRAAAGTHGGAARTAWQGSGVLVCARALPCRRAHRTRKPVKFGSRPELHAGCGAMRDRFVGDLLAAGERSYAINNVSTAFARLLWPASVAPIAGAPDSSPAKLKSCDAK